MKQNQQSCNTPLQGHLSVEKTVNSNHEYHPSIQAANPETMLQITVILYPTEKK